jgi:hypothetical protein
MQLTGFTDILELPITEDMHDQIEFLAEENGIDDEELCRKALAVGLALVDFGVTLDPVESEQKHPCNWSIRPISVDEALPPSSNSYVVRFEGGEAGTCFWEGKSWKNKVPVSHWYKVEPVRTRLPIPKPPKIEGEWT